ncbi:MAG TPA: SBBP repeat-containing protein [candidate division Zixibacteria bacterium]
MLKSLKIGLGVVMLLLFVGPAFAQTVDTAWVRRYDGSNGRDESYAIAVDDSGYVYVTGWAYISGSDYDYATIKYYPNGDTAWVRRYNGPGNSDDGAIAIAIDDSGYVYVTGYGEGIGTNYDYITIKYHANGDTAWLRRYNGPVNLDDITYAMVVDGSGYVYVTGYSYGDGTSADYATIKYHPNGDTVWVRRYNGLGNLGDVAYAMVEDGSGNVCVTGGSRGSGTWEDCATIKYHPNGDTAWVRRFDEPTIHGYDRGTAIAVDLSGNIYVTGWSDGAGTGADYFTIRYYPNGDTAWVRRYNGPANGTDWATAIAVDDSGYVFVTGYSDSSGSSQDYATIKYDSSGNEIWVKRFNCANGTDKPYAIAVDGSNNIYVTGMSGCGGTTGIDYATIKYYPNGDTAWLRKYHGPVENGSDYAYALAVDDSGNVYITGGSQGSGTGYDYCTIKYVQTSSAVKDETGDRERPSEFELSQNYPNPFNPNTKIEFTLAKAGFVTLQIYDVLGRKVRTLVSENLPSGYKSVMWDGKNDDGKDVASGVYFYQLKVGDFSEPKKMVLLK